MGSGVTASICGSYLYELWSYFQLLSSLVKWTKPKHLQIMVQIRLIRMFTHCNDGYWDLFESNYPVTCGCFEMNADIKMVTAKSKNPCYGLCHMYIQKILESPLFYSSQQNISLLYYECRGNVELKNGTVKNEIPKSQSIHFYVQLCINSVDITIRYWIAPSRNQSGYIILSSKRGDTELWWKWAPIFLYLLGICI